MVKCLLILTCDSDDACFGVEKKVEFDFIPYSGLEFTICGNSSFSVCGVDYDLDAGFCEVRFDRGFEYPYEQDFLRDLIASGWTLHDMGGVVPKEFRHQLTQPPTDSQTP